MTEGSTTGTVLSAAYTALVLADLVVVVDIISNGALHRWAARHARSLYRQITDPLRSEAEMRRASAWVVWEAIQLLEEAAAQ